MSDILRALIALEGDRRLHQARILVLLRAFVGNKNTATVEGLTKLAKLDFLLRYPTYLERAIAKRQGQVTKVAVRDEERLSVESRMVRYRYGPWDDRYRELLNELVGLDLAHVAVRGRTVHIGLTDHGLGKAQALSESPVFEDVARRAGLLRTNLNLSATGLMRFVYETFPEIADMRLREEIQP
jgi:hypothetical protein